MTANPGQASEEDRSDYPREDLDPPAELPADVYRQLHDIAARLFRRERPNHTLQATALVHEAFVALRGETPERWEDGEEVRRFVGSAVLAMRHILIDYARRHRHREPGSAPPEPFDEAVHCIEERSFDHLGLRIALWDLEEALEALEQVDPGDAGIANLRLFGGLTIREIASTLSLTRSTVEDHWKAVRAWLVRRLGEEQAP